MLRGGERGCSWTSPVYECFRVSFQQGLLRLSSRLCEFIFSHVLETPCLIWFHITQLLSPPSISKCLGCLSVRPRRRGCSEEFLHTFVIAPQFVLLKLWRVIVPPPCQHRRCELRRYVSPPPPWYGHVKSIFFQPMQTRYAKIFRRRSEEHQPKPFPILRLPIEIRNLIYLHASSTSKHKVRVQGPWSTGDSQANIYGWATTSSLVSGCDGPHQHGHGDAISYQLNNKAVIAYHGPPPPPANVLLVCKQMYQEAQEQFLSTTAFEVQPLTPNDTSWRLDYSLAPTYQALAESRYAPFMRKVLVRVDVARFCMSRKSKRFPRATSQVCTFREIELGESVEKLTMLAEELCRVVKKSVPKSKVVEIHWIDDFPKAVAEHDLQLKKRILRPFLDLKGVRVRVGKLVMAEEGRLVVQAMAKKVLNQSCS